MPINKRCQRSAHLPQSQPSTIHTVQRTRLALERKLSLFASQGCTGAMSTRVQKGNTVFKPIARPRAQPGAETRRISVVADAPCSSSDVETRNGEMQPPSVLAAMPSPSRIPSNPTPIQPAHMSFEEHGQTVVSETSMISLDTKDGVTAESVAFASRVTVSSRDGARPPTIETHVASTLSPPKVSSRGIPVNAPSRSAATPIMVGRRAVPVVFPASTIPETSAIAALPSAQAATLFSISVPQIDPTLVNACPLLGSSSHTTSQDNTSLLHQSQGEDSAAAAPKPRQRLSQKQSAGDQGEFAADWEYDRGTDEQGIRSGKSRSRRAPDAASHSERDDEPLGGLKRRRHRSSTGSRKPRTRASSVVPLELNTGPGEELDPTAVIMATLCDDTGQGRISSKTVQIMTNHAAWRAANKEKRERMKAAMEAKKYGRTIQDEDQPPPKADTEVTESLEDGVAPDAVLAGQSASIENRPIEKVRRANDDFDYTQNLATSRYNVQVRIGANGEAIIDEDSLFVNRNEEEHTEHYTHVEESDTTKFVNSLTYSRKLRGSRWSAEETELFYDALSQFGENYELIAYVLPGRDRKSCKNKFKAEDKKNPARINHCLNNRKPVDIQTLSRMTGKDFSGPTPIIRAPTPLRSTQLDASLHSAGIEDLRPVKEKSKTPGSAGEAEEEILGFVDEIENGNSPSRGSHTTEYPQKPYI